MSAKFIIGPFLFETISYKGLVRTTLTSSSYSSILQNRLILALQAVRRLNRTVFMQRDSSDLNPCDFSLWRYVKYCVYKEKHNYFAAL